MAEISRSLDDSKIGSIMSYLYHIEHNHEWAIGAKFVISAYDVPPTRIGRPVLGSTDFEWARHYVVSSVEMRPYTKV